jgi:hypothetical protein
MHLRKVYNKKDSDMKKIMQTCSVLLLPLALLGTDDYSNSFADDVISADDTSIQQEVNQELIDTINKVIDTLGLRNWYNTIADDESRSVLIDYIFALLGTTQEVAAQYSEIFQRIQELTGVEIPEFTASLHFTPAALPESAE